MSFYDTRPGATSTDAAPAKVGLVPKAQPPRLVNICLILNVPRSDEQEAIPTLTLFKNWLDASLPADTNVKYKLDSFWSQEEDYPTREQLDQYEMVLFSGSLSDAWGDDPWITTLMMFIQEVANHHQKIKLFGICFGSQIVGRALGATVQPNPKGWEIGVTEVKTTALGKLLFGVGYMNLLLFHSDMVYPDTLSDFFTTGDLYLLGNSLRTPLQGIVKFYPPDEQEGLGDELIHRVHIFTTQGHPEWTQEYVTQLLHARHGKGEVDTEGFKQYFGEKGHLSDTKPVMKQDTGKRWIDHYDGVRVVGKTFWRMLNVHYGVEHPPVVPA